jgi:transmembrane sensor
MLENEFYISELIATHLRGDISPLQLEELNVWLAQSEANQAWYQEFNKGGKLGEQLKLFNEINETAIWKKTINQIKQRPVVNHVHTKSLYNIAYKITAAAIILIALTIGLYTYLHKENPDHGTLFTNDIAPGKTGATLTLANGKKIRLTDVPMGEVAKESGISITKNVAGQLVYQIKGNPGESNSMNTLSTARGETYVVILPDQSKVWMNAASSLTYATSLNEHGIRKVKLDGEAYFEVAKDKVHPFIVETNGQQVEVLGTHFNISGYNDEESIKTTLLEGSVKVIANNNHNKVLKPGQQSSLSATGKLSVTEVDTKLFTAWKDNKFIFDNDDIKSVMRIVQRWYNVEVIYTGQLPDDNFGGKISRFSNVSSVLRILESTGGVHFKIEGRKIYVSK